MKRNLLCIVLAIFVVFSAASTGFSETQKSSGKELTVYCYGSFLGDWGPGASIGEAYEQKTGIPVRFVDCGSAVELLQKLQYEGDRTEADMVIGIDDSIAVDYSIFAPVSLNPSIQFATSLGIQEGVLVPFDYGVYSFVADTTRLDRLPGSLDDLLLPEYKGKVILIDPRTSSVGMGLLLWTVAVYSEDHYLDWWKQMKENALTIADSWSSGYGLFTEGEAPLVISYTTSPVYHVMYEDTTTIRALEFTDGHFETVEYAGILKSSENRDKAEDFLNFVLTEGQSTIAVANSMFPANSACTLPDAFEYAVTPAKLFSPDRLSIKENSSRYLKEWSDAMVL